MCNQSTNQPINQSIYQPTNQSITERTVRVGEPDVIHQTSWRKSTDECSGRPKAFGQHCAPKEANATLVRTKQGSMLLPNACIKGAIKQKVLIFDSVPVTMATDALTCEWLLMLGTQSSRHMPHIYIRHRSWHAEHQS